MNEEVILLDRMRTILTIKNIDWIEKNMMGGKCFMVDDKMCFGTFKGGLMCRVEPLETEILLTKEGSSIMELGGKEMKGYLFVQPNGFSTENELEFWISKCLAFNPKAKSSKKKK